MSAAAEKSKKELVGNVAASATSIVIGSAAFNWLDCLRVRWQVHAPMQGETLLFYFRDIVRNEGLFKGLWLQGLSANLCACGASYGFRVGTYPLVRDGLVLAVEGDSGQKASHHMVRPFSSIT